ncbi:MAG TPA: lipid II flippase MurJ [Candidatus Saccharimonadales bacterium]|nr:lipid II flippase MurJ [Candidatus Saccharimonadales bacterium]
MNRFLDRTNKRISLGGAATLLIVVMLLGQVLGFLRNRFISTNFTVHDPGASDAFFAAFQIPDFFFYTISAGALGVAFMPILSDRLTSGDRKGMWQIANSLLNVLAVAMAVVGVIIFLFAEQLIGVLAPNLPKEHFDQAVVIMRFIAFNPLLFTLSGIVTSIQQTFGRFFFFAIAPLFYNFAIIASIFMFKDSIGIIGLGIGALVGGVLQLAIAWLGLIGLKFRYKPEVRWGNEGFRKVMHQLPARSLDQGIDQVNSMVEVNRAQALGTGPVSYYSYALTLHNVPIMLIGTSIATAAFPRLIERLSQNRPDLFRKDFLRILRTMIWMTVPVVIIAFFCRGYLARLIYGDAAPEVALIFGFLTAAIIFRIIYAMMSRYFYANKDTKTPLAVSIIAISLNIALAFWLARAQSYGVAGLAIAQSASAGAEVFILGVIMLWRDRKLFNDIEFWGGLMRIVGVAGFCLTTGFIMLQLYPLGINDRGLITIGSKVFIIAAVVFGVHLTISSLFGLREASAVFERAKKLIIKPIRIQ